MKGIKLEDTLITALTCKVLGLPGHQSPESYNAEKIDFEYVINASLRQGLFLLISKELIESRHPDINENNKSAIKALTRNLKIKSIQMSAELLGICNVLASHKITVTPFKGPTLSLAVYGKDCLRDFSDLDILVKKEDVGLVLKILADRGYKQIVELDKLQLERYIEYEDDMQLHSPKGIILEVHWEATGRFTAVPLDYYQLEPTFITMDFYGRKVQQFGYDYLLIYLCIHGARHSWERLEWLCSVACLTRDRKLIDFEAVLAASRKLGCRRTVLHSFSLAQKVFGVTLPATIREEINNDKNVRDVIRRENSFLFSASETSHAKGNRFKLIQFVLRDSKMDSMKYLFKQMFWLRVADVQFIRLPSVLFPLYYIVRPYRLMLQSLKNMCK